MLQDAKQGTPDRGGTAHDSCHAVFAWRQYRAALSALAAATQCAAA